MTVLQIQNWEGNQIYSTNYLRRSELNHISCTLQAIVLSSDIIFIEVIFAKLNIVWHKDKCGE